MVVVFQYKIELRVRNHNTVPRPILIQTIAQSVPEGHTVDLDDPQLFILVEVFKVRRSWSINSDIGLISVLQQQSICGISIVEDYYKMQKFNVMEIVNKKNRTTQPEEGRVFPGVNKLSQIAGDRMDKTSEEIEEKEEEIKVDAK
jgi:tRNA acetyltransferase TAN1